jgi:acyl dehydratase
MAGLWFEDCDVGKRLSHSVTRTVTEMDNMLFSCLTMNTQPLHIDRHFAAQSEFGQPLMNSMFTLALVVGISVNETTLGTLVAQLSLTDAKFPAPLFQGDSIRVETQILSARESKSRPNAGVVEFVHRAYKQDGSLVAECKRAALLLKRQRVE